MDEYIRIINKNTELFSTADPDLILDTLIQYAETQGYKNFQVAKDKYKMKLSLVNKEGEPCEMKVELLKADPEKICIDFTKTDGDSLVFYKEFNVVKDFLGDLVDASF